MDEVEPESRPSHALGSRAMKRWFGRSPLVGVVVPAYGVEEWLDECLRSLVRQTHARWEAVAG